MTCPPPSLGHAPKATPPGRAGAAPRVRLQRTAGAGVVNGLWSGSRVVRRSLRAEIDSAGRAARRQGRRQRPRAGRVLGRAPRMRPGDAPGASPDSGRLRGGCGQASAPGAPRRFAGGL